MRADRLLSLMLLLQKRKQMTAEALANELEVSKRTIYRDINALSFTGVPVYAIGGPGGGYALLDSYQTTILKLTSTLPERHQAQADYIRQRLHLDAARWFQPDEPTHHLKVAQDAAWQDLQLHLSYRRRDGTVRRRTVSPYGLIANAGIWYLVAATDNGVQVYRVSRIESVELTQTQFVRPQDFDLINFWRKWVADYEANLQKYPVTLNIGPDLVPTLSFILGEGVRPLIEKDKPDADGWRILDYTFERVEEARMFVLWMGASAEVIAPEELRLSVLNFATEIIAHYTH
jgi:predicted DNA-binding transcriptional regulator YafY